MMPFAERGGDHETDAAEELTLFTSRLLGTPGTVFQRYQSLLQYPTHTHHLQEFSQ